MTAIAVSRSSLVHFPEVALSQAAPDIGRQWIAYRETDTSITRGLRVRELFARIEAAAHKASASDWDGDGARATDATTIDFAYIFASGLPSHLPLPEVSADKDGDIAFDWDYGARRVFSVSVRRDGVLSYAGLVGSARFYGSDVLFGGIPIEVVQGITRVSSGLV